MKVWVLCGYDCVPFAVCKTRRLAMAVIRAEKITGTLKSGKGHFEIVSKDEQQTYEATASCFTVKC